MNIQMLWNSDNNDLWKKALDNYWNLIPSKAFNLEKKMNNLDIELIKRMSGEEFYNFLYYEYFVWKYTAKNRLATTRKSLALYQLNNKFKDLVEIQEKIFNSETRSIKTATEIRGLGVAGASGLLSLLFPSEYGCVDQFLVKSLVQVDEYKEDVLLHNIKPEGIKLSEGEYLEKILRSKAQDLNSMFNTEEWTPRKIDMILWSVERVPI